MKIRVEYINTEDLIPYAGNAKIHTAEQVKQIKTSIEEFGFNDPIAVWKDNEIIEGHGRLIAAKELGIKQVPVIRLDSLTDEQRKAYALVHNKLTMNTGFDTDLLQLELDSISELDMEQFGFERQEEAQEEKYTGKTDIVQYEPSGEDRALSECYDDSKTEMLIRHIEESGIGEDEKEFLKKAAARHTVFKYKTIADYYASASEEMQALMEESALVIIDYDDAILNGYTRLTEIIEEDGDA